VLRERLVSHRELVFPLDAASEVLSMMGSDGLVHVEELPSGNAKEEAPRRYTVSPIIESWAHGRK
jgi:hypothetical protein